MGTAQSQSDSTAQACRRSTYETATQQEHLTSLLLLVMAPVEIFPSSGTGMGTEPGLLVFTGLVRQHSICVIATLGAFPILVCRSALRETCRWLATGTGTAPLQLAYSGHRTISSS